MYRVMTRNAQVVDRARGDPRVTDKSHLLSRRNRVHPVIGNGSGIGEGLPNVLELELRDVLDNLLWRHTVRDQIYNVSNRYTKAAHARAPCENVWIVCDTVEHFGHRFGAAPGTTFYSLAALA